LPAPALPDRPRGPAAQGGARAARRARGDPADAARWIRREPTRARAGRPDARLAPRGAPSRGHPAGGRARGCGVRHRDRPGVRSLGAVMNALVSPLASARAGATAPGERPPTPRAANDAWESLLRAQATLMGGFEAGGDFDPLSAREYDVLYHLSRSEQGRLPMR